jgi:predicted methyltransferase
MAAVGLLLVATVTDAQRAPTSDELRDAEHDVPHLAAVLDLKPGMTVADVGAGMGAMTIVMARWLGPTGRLFASDVAETALTALRDTKAREHLETVTVVPGAAGATNLPDGCCDAIWLRDVYHHVTEPADFNRSLLASLRPGGRLAIIDFRPESGSQAPKGLPADRTGHGITPSIVEREVRAAGFVHVRTIDAWPPESTRHHFFLVLFRRE